MKTTFFILLFCLSIIAAETATEEPDYGARPLESSTSDQLLWVPRVILFPVYLGAEYMVRRPVGWLARRAELGDWATQLISFFTFGPNKEVGIFPTALVDFGFRSSVGLYAYWKDVFSPKNRITLQAGTGGSDYYRLTLTDSYQSNENTRYSLTLNLNHRPDWIFHGIGSSSNKNHRARYTADRKEAVVAFEKQPFENANVSIKLNIRRLRFSDGSCCGDPSLSAQVSSGSFPQPSGFGSGYTAFSQELDFEFGKPVFRPEGRVGGRVHVGASHHSEIKEPQFGDWWRYKMDLKAFYSLTERYRQVWWMFQVDFVNKIGQSQVPFSELAQLGGNGPLPGFLQGRLLGLSTISSTIAYTWPIWTFFDGVVHLGVGNAFGEDLSGFEFKKLRKSVGIGMRAIGGSGSAFQFLVALGSDTFEDGGDFNEFRVVLGVSSAL